MVFGVIIFAFAIQLFFCLVGIAVAAGTGYVPNAAFSHLLCWPVYFISLAFAVLMSIVKCLKHCTRAQACCPEDNS
jgi:hypothetical protein